MKKGKGTDALSGYERKLRRGGTARQVNALTAVEGAARLGVLLPLLTAGVWRGRALGVFTAACIAGVCVSWFLERCMWAEDAFFHTLLFAHGRKRTLAMYAALFWFFRAQSAAMLRLAAEVMAYYFEGRQGTDGGFFPYSFFFLPFLVSSAVNALFYMRRLFRRLCGEGCDCCPALQKAWIRNACPWLWCASAVLVCILALGFSDRYALAGFYCAYNWQLMAGAFALAWLYAAVRAAAGRKQAAAGRVHEG